MHPSNNHNSAHICRLLACVIALGWAGCASTGTTTDVGHYVVSVPQTPMFRYGPAQSFGADLNLTEGQHVVMLKREYGYSRVMTDEGQSGYVATEDLKPAPVPASSATNISLPHRGLSVGGGGRTGTSSAANRAVIQTGPLFSGEDVPPLPERDPLQPGNAPPGFRINVPQRKAGDPAPESKTPAESQPKTEAGKSKPGFRINVPTRDGSAKKP